METQKDNLSEVKGKLNEAWDAARRAGLPHVQSLIEKAKDQVQNEGNPICKSCGAYYLGNLGNIRDDGQCDLCGLLALIVV